MTKSNLLMKRLTRLDHPAEQVLQLRPGLTSTARIRFADILDALKEGRATKDDNLELQRLLVGSRMVHFSRSSDKGETPK